MTFLTKFTATSFFNKKVLFESFRNFSYNRSNFRTVLRFPQTQTVFYVQQHYQSTNEESKSKKGASSIKLSQKALLKQTIRDYGSTIIVFHVAISLASLGVCYIAVSNGLDVMKWLQHFNFPESVIRSKIAVGSSTFVMAYALHKVFAPLRIGITLTSAPLIVKYLRKINLLKTPK